MIEKNVTKELESLDAGGREIWHSKGFSQALYALELAGAEHKERVARIRQSMEPYKAKGRVYDVPDM